jgi:hypothetical protein
VQVESSLAVQSLKPRVDMIKARYGDEKEKVQRETNLLYQQAGVNPLAGGWWTRGREGGRGNALLQALQVGCPCCTPVSTFILPCTLFWCKQLLL